jgi:hypothetical protein
MEFKLEQNILFLFPKYCERLPPISNNENLEAESLRDQKLVQ